MDVVISANLQSVTLTSLQRSLITSFEYILKKNYPNLSKSKVQLSPSPAGAITNSNGIDSQVLTFTLPLYGLITDLMFQSTLTTTGNNNVNVIGSSTQVQSSLQAGLSLFSSVYLLSNNKIICSNTDGYLRVRQTSDKLNKGISSAFVTRFFSTDGVTVASTWSNQNVITYVPFYCSFFERVENYLDLSFVNQLQIQVTYNTKANMGLAAAITSATTYLWMNYYNLEAPQLAKLRALNFNPAGTYVALGYDVLQETGQITDSSTSYTILPQCQYCAFATHVFLKNRSTNALLSVTSMTVSMGGRVLYQTIPIMVLNRETDQLGGSGLIQYDTWQSQLVDLATAEAGTGASTLTTRPLVNFNPIRPVTIWWGLDNCRDYNSGAVSLHNVTNLSILVNCASTSTTDWYCVTEYWTLVNVNPADGNISISQSM